MAEHKSSVPIRDFVRERTDSGEWDEIDALCGLQTVFLLYGMDLGISLSHLLHGVTEGYQAIIEQDEGKPQCPSASRRTRNESNAASGRVGGAGG